MRRARVFVVVEERRFDRGAPPIVSRPAAEFFVKDHWPVAPTGPSSLHPAEYKEPKHFFPPCSAHYACSLFRLPFGKIIHFNIAGQLSPLVASQRCAVSLLLLPFGSNSMGKSYVSHWVASR